MSRSIASQAIAACLALLGAFGTAQAQTESAGRSDPGSTFSSAGTHIKKGAQDFGEGVKQGAETVGETVKNTAIDIWEAGKAAVGAGARKLDERHSPPPAKE
jgi:hypothetical protein